MRETLRGVRVLLAVWVITNLLLAALAASAQESAFYVTKWPADNLEVDWRFTSDFPDGRMRRLSISGAQQWNALEQPMTFLFDPDLPDYEPFSPSVCADPESGEEFKNALHWGPTPDGGAFTVACSTPSDANGGVMQSFQIKFASNTSWYVGRKMPPYGYDDFFSFATHEFGHATGRINGGDGAGHFLDTNPKLCTRRVKAHHTMCQTAPKGSAYDRSLNRRDRAEFSEAY